MSQFASVLIFAFLIKLTIVILLTRILKKYCISYLESGIAAWVLLQIGIMAWMIVLSFFNLLNGEWLWLGLGATTLILILNEVVAHKRNIQTLALTSDINTFFSPYALMPLFLLFVLFAFFVYRSLYYFDNTFDGIAYELTRISFYAHYHSLFVLQDTSALNIFVDEWNGELNALFYVLATGKDQATSFGNVEIWLLGCFAFTWVFECLKIDNRFRLLLGVALSTTPVILGLTMTVKGDLLSVIAFIISMGFVICYYTRGKSSFYFLLAIASLGLSLGAKKTAIVTIGLLYIILMIDYLKTKDLSFIQKYTYGFLASILFLVGNFRYFLNCLLFHNPIAKVEQMHGSILNIPKNLRGILEYIYYKPFSPGGGYLLSGGLGVVGIALTISLIYQRTMLLSNKQTGSHNKLLSISKRNLGYLGTAFIIGLLALMFQIGWAPYSLRYFSTWLFTVLVLLLAYNFHDLRSQVTRTLMVSCLIVMGINIFVYLIVILKKKIKQG